MDLDKRCLACREVSTTDLIKNGSISFWIEVGVRAPAVKHHLETLNTFQLSIVKKLRRSRRVVLPERKSSLRIS